MIQPGKTGTAIRCQTRFLLSMAGIVALLVMISACDQQSSKGKKKGRRFPTHLVEVHKVRIQPFAVSVVRTGTLVARTTLKIHNQEEGMITRLPFYEGDKVSKGQVLVKMDDALLHSLLQKATATREQKSQNLRRIRSLSARKLVSQDQLVKAETEFKVAQAEENHLKTRYGNTTITAPFDGVVTARNRELKDVIPRYTHILTFVDPTSLVTRVKISELLIPAYQVGTRVQVQIDALGNRSFPGVISRIHPTVDADTRQGVIEVRLDPIPPKAKIGQLCRVKLETSLDDKVVIPFSALRRDRKGEYIYIVSDTSKAKRVRVQSGLRSGAFVVITSGLEPGMQVVTRGFLGLRHGKKVDVANRPGDKTSDKKAGKKPDKNRPGMKTSDAARHKK